MEVGLEAECLMPGMLGAQSHSGGRHDMTSASPTAFSEDEAREGGANKGCERGAYRLPGLREGQFQKMRPAARGAASQAALGTKRAFQECPEYYCVRRICVAHWRHETASIQGLFSNQNLSAICVIICVCVHPDVHCALCEPEA